MFTRHCVNITALSPLITAITITALTSQLTLNTAFMLGFGSRYCMFQLFLSMGGLRKGKCEYSSTQESVWQQKIDTFLQPSQFKTQFHGSEEQNSNEVDEVKYVYCRYKKLHVYYKL